MAFPESGEVLRHLLGASARRQQMESQWDAPVADRRPPREPEEVLHARAHRRRLAFGVLDLHLAAARKNDGLGRKPVEALGRQRPEEVGFTQLPQ